MFRSQTSTAIRIHARHLLLAVLFLLVWPSLLCAHHGYANVLVLHSYDPELRWTADINQAIRKTLLEQRSDLSIHVEYLDTKRNPSAGYAADFIENVLPKKLSGHHFEVILTSDNDAFNFLLRHQQDLFAGVPAVFCGVNGFDPQMLEGHENITGLTETLAIKETLELALQLHPQARRLVFIGETVTDTGQKIDQDIRSLQSELPRGIDLSFWNDLNLEDLGSRIAQAPEGTLLFPVSTVHDRNGRTYSYTESTRKLREYSQVPLYGIWDFQLGNGIVGGNLTSAMAQGKMAAERALRILNGEKAGNIPISRSGSNRMMFDFNELKRFSIPDRQLPDESIVINSPPGYYRLDKWQYWAGILIILLLFLSLSLLLRIISLKRKNERVLTERAHLASIDAEIGQTLTRGAPLQETLNACLETLLKYTGTSFARIWTLSDTDPTLLELRASTGLFTRIDGRHRFKRIGELKVGIIARDKQPIITNELLGDPIFTDQDWIQREGIRGFAGFPLILKGNLVGVVAFFSKDTMHEDIHKTMASVADMLAVGIERHRTDQALQTALSEAENSRDNIDAILRSVIDGLIVTDLDEHITLINQSAERILGVTFAQSRGKSLHQLLGSTPLRGQLLELFAGKFKEVEIDIPAEETADAGPTTLMAATAPVQRKDGSPGGTVAILHDITRERQLDRQKSEFIATAAHELRTPITTIQGYAELLAGEDPKAPYETETRQEFLRYILEKAAVLEQLIDDLLDLGRVESGRLIVLDKQPTEMVTLVKEIVQHHQQETQNHLFEMSCPLASLPIKLDRVKIQSVLDNLISNAVKYSPAGGKIKISGTVQEGWLQVCIEDQGIGLSKEQLGQAFNKFYRADSSDSATRGLGLGLTISKGIVEAHGGTIWLESSEGQGTRACFTLPLTATGDP